MAHRLEFFQGRRPHPLGGGIRGHQLRVLLLQSGELLKQAVEFRVRDHRVIQDIVAVVVVIDLLPELFYPGQDVLGDATLCHDSPH